LAIWCFSLFSVITLFHLPPPPRTNQAFLLPILEKILQQKSYHSGSFTKALILSPTRELAAQTLTMMVNFSRFILPHDLIRGCLIVGGAKNVKSQTATLKTRPDIIVATPGRLLDHLLNSTGFTLHDLNFLVLDEADRLLELGFSEEIQEILKYLPKSNDKRQTLLFSATLADTKVDDLIRLSLKRPIRIAVSSTAEKKVVEVAPRLEQEFVRIRLSQEANREAILLSLLTRTYQNQRLIVFFDTKSLAHRFRIIAGLSGIMCEELHGDLTQPQRLEALQCFREGKVNVLLATDLIGRGIDVPDVDAVLNYDMPNQLASYIHRIGRTARAGR
jgi:ATP-dependent RNA helicase DDX27